jgi:hypothetical protein
MTTAVRLCALVVIVSALLAQTPPSNAPPNKQDQQIDSDYAAEKSRNTPSTASEPTPASTRIGQHRIGETAQQWLPLYRPINTSQGFDLSVCQKKRPNAVDKYNCGRLQNLYTGQIEESSIENNRMYTWKFSNGQLIEVGIMPDFNADRREDRRLDFQQELSFLTQTYGKPAEIQSVPYHNAFGAQWQRSIARWDMPDGTTIFEYEQTAFDRQGDVLSITFISKEAAAKLLDQKAKPNPYQQ